MRTHTDRVAQNIRFQQARTRMEALANAQGLQSSVTAGSSSVVLGYLPMVYVLDSPPSPVLSSCVSPSWYPFGSGVSREEVERMVTDEMVVDKLAEMLIGLHSQNCAVDILFMNHGKGEGIWPLSVSIFSLLHAYRFVRARLSVSVLR